LLLLEAVVVDWAVVVVLVGIALEHYLLAQVITPFI
jgi:hypothetical protein